MKRFPWQLPKEEKKEEIASIPQQVPPNPDAAQTSADILDWLVQRFKATYEIRQPNDGVFIIFTMPDGDVVSSGLASNTAKAVLQLKERLDKNA